MDVKTLQKKKQNLEQKMQKLILEFQEEIPVSIDEIEIDNIGSYMGENKFVFHIKIKI